jgi:DNA-binding Lrp family transcriptional regulator
MNMEIAYVLVKSEIAHEMDVLNEILKIDGVKEVKGTFGLYDIFVKIEASSGKELQKIITKKIRHLKHVISTTTLSVIPEQGGSD